MSDIYGTAGDEWLPGSAGDDVFHGLGGRDTAQVAAPSSSAVFSLDAQNRWVVTSAQGVDTMDSIEAIQFADGTVTPGTEFRINGTTAGAQRYASIAKLVDGTYVAAWSSDADGDGSGAGIYTQHFDANGGRLGGETLVSVQPAADRSYSWVAALQGGGYVVTWAAAAATWQNDPTSQWFDVHAQRSTPAARRSGATSSSTAPPPAPSTRQAAAWPVSRMAASSWSGNPTASRPLAAGRRPAMGSGCSASTRPARG